MRSQYEWKNESPANPGDYFYTGPLPGEEINVVCIVSVFEKDGLNACFFMPPNWRCGDNEATLFVGKIEEWKGQWAGPEYGICHVTYGGNS